jgi:thioredoxin-related protein
MKKIIEAHPNVFKNGRYDGLNAYEDIIDTFEYETILQVDDQDYQGDSRILLKDGDRYGLLIFGWGSCSGCDALQACETIEELDSLQESLYNSIIWYDSANEMYDFLKNRDWEVQSCWYRQETKDFLQKVLDLLQGAV